MPHPPAACQRLSRVELMKRFLDEHADEIERWGFGQIRFDWNPGDVKTFIGRSGKLGDNRDERLSA